MSTQERWLATWRELGASAPAGFYCAGSMQVHFKLRRRTFMSSTLSPIG